MLEIVKEMTAMLTDLQSSMPKDTVPGPKSLNDLKETARVLARHEADAAYLKNAAAQMDQILKKSAMAALPKMITAPSKEDREQVMSSVLSMVCCGSLLERMSKATVVDGGLLIPV